MPNLTTEHILGFTFIFVRISAMLVMIPVMGERSVPLRVKAGLALLIALLVFPVIHLDMPHLQVDADAEIIAITLAMTGEVMIGLIIGFAASMIFAGIRFAGDMIGIQMGLSIVNVIDPVSSTQVSIMAEFQYLFAMLVYLAVDGHHMFISAIFDSYRFVTPFAHHVSASLIQSILMYSKELFVTAVKICAPVMAVLLFSNVALGVVARTVPQINVFIVGMPLQVATGLIIFGLTIPVFVSVVQRALDSLNREIQVLMRLM
ncbi:MAG: flagellar biosynthetic protein FliR [Pseudomonadota bacterium]